MQFFVYLIRVHPWILPLMAVSLVVWIAALVLVVRSPKFRRKWLWALLTLLSFSWGWSYGGSSLSVGIPLGALYVLGFWWLGPSPTAEQLAEDAARRAARVAPIGSRRQVMTLRVAYLIGAAGPVVLAGFAALGYFGRLILAIPDNVEPETATNTMIFARFESIVMLLIAGLFAFLAWRPYWWGKIVCAWAGLSWLGFGLVFALMMPALGKASGNMLLPSVVLISGAILLIVGLVHQFTDPRFSGSYLRLA